jgi:hypothetical protein
MRRHLLYTLQQVEEVLRGGIALKSLATKATYRWLAEPDSMYVVIAGRNTFSGGDETWFCYHVGLHSAQL